MLASLPHIGHFFAALTFGIVVDHVRESGIVSTTTARKLFVYICKYKVFKVPLSTSLVTSIGYQVRIIGFNAFLIGKNMHTYVTMQLGFSCYQESLSYFSSCCSSFSSCSFDVRSWIYRLRSGRPGCFVHCSPCSDSCHPSRRFCKCC